LKTLDAPTDGALLRKLLERTAAADRTAFKSLYDQTSSRVFGILLRLLRDRELAEDVTQETYVSIWRKAHLYNADLAQPMTWIVAIARNRAIDEIRKRRDVRALPAEADADQVYDEQGLTAEDRLASRDGLSRCMETLDQRHKAMIKLAYVDGYSREELSRRFDLSVNTVKTWLRRGLGSLKQCLETS
jgi:RNA polymerase sigma factor (sigma-70 family)